MFVDDREENLISVRDSLQKHCPTIQYEGFQYIGALNYPSKTITEEEFKVI